MRAFLHRLLPGLLVLTAVSSPAQGSSSPGEPPPVPQVAAAASAGKGAPVDAALAALRVVMEEDDRAQEEVAAWEEEMEAGDSAARLLLAGRISVRLSGVRARYEDLVRSQPAHAPTRVAFASFLGETGDEPGAILQLEEAVRLDPADASAWNNLANHYGHIGPVRKAFGAYETAIALRPDEPLYRYNYGTTLFLFRKDAGEHFGCDEQAVFARALEQYRIIRRLRPDDFRYAYDFAQTYYGVKPAPAETEAGRRAARDRLIAEALGAWGEALAVADNELDRQGVLLHQARWHLQAGRTEAARTNLVQAVDPRHSAVRERLERVLREADGGGGSAGDR